MKKITREKGKDIALRAVKTFIEAAIPILIASVSAVDISQGRDAVRAVIGSAVLSAAAAGISAVWNLITAMTAVKKQESEEETDEATTDEGGNEYGI